VEFQFARVHAGALRATLFMGSTPESFAASGRVLRGQVGKASHPNGSEIQLHRS
jgi:hypothetical protein